MPISDVVDLQIDRRTAAIERAGFGVLNALSMHRAWADRIRFYTEADDVLADGFGTKSEAYLSALAYFSQTPKPESLAIGRLATGDTVTVQIDEVANTTKYTVWIDGVGFSFTSDADATSAEIEAGLTTIINSGYAITAAAVAATNKFTIAGNFVSEFPVGKQFRVDGSTGNDGAYTVKSVVLESGSTEIITEEDVADATADGAIVSKTAVTATDSGSGDGFVDVAPDVASTFFECRTSSNTHLEFNLDGDIATNIAAIRAVDDDWYGVTLARQYGSENKDHQREVADVVETLRKIFIPGSDDEDIFDDSLSVDDPNTGTIARQLQAVAYARSAVLAHREQTGSPVDDSFGDAAWFGARFPTDPGTETWKFEALAGVVPDDLSSTERKNALDKNANIYVPLTADRAITEEGTMAEGEFIDVIRYIDFLYNEMTLNVLDALLNPVPPLNKIPYTDAGIAIIENKVRESLQAGVDSGALASFTVTVPKAADVSQADKAARILRDVKFTAVLSGAIHAVEIRGTVTV